MEAHPFKMPANEAIRTEIVKAFFTCLAPCSRAASIRLERIQCLALDMCAESGYRGCRISCIRGPVQFSTSIEYAVHTLIYMAGDIVPRGRLPLAGRNASTAGLAAPILVGEIARAIKAPESYLRKVLQLLARGGLLVSHRGVKGGFSLARDARGITLRDVVEAVDGSLPTWCCVKENQRCSEAPCPVSAAFEDARRKMAESLEQTTIGDLARRVAKRADGWLAVTSCS
jgi:Rrf2 family protein